MKTICLQVLFLGLLASLSSCSLYSSSFGCKDARGLNCLPLSSVDKRISSGEIGEVELRAAAKCRGRNCLAKELQGRPALKQGKPCRIKLEPESEEAAMFKNGNLLYVY